MVCAMFVRKSPWTQIISDKIWPLRLVTYAVILSELFNFSFAFTSTNKWFEPNQFRCQKTKQVQHHRLAKETRATTTKRSTTTTHHAGNKVEILNEVPLQLVSPRKKYHEPKKVGLYIHIPYCRRRCYYCNFSIIPVGNKTSTSDGFSRMNKIYVDALKKELCIAQLPKRSNKTGEKRKVLLQSIYFGGGTPSLLPISSLKDIMNTISQHSIFEIDDFSEITIEIDPGTFTIEMLREWKLLGINRLSFGVQSFDNLILHCLGRTHTVNDIYNSIKMIESVYGSNVNYSIDLISGVPGLTLAKWIETLDVAINTLNPQPNHLSIYDLQIEEGTVYGKLFAGSLLNVDGENYLDVVPQSDTTEQKGLPSSHDAGFMYKYTSGYLRSKNYEHYETSSYALLKIDNMTNHDQGSNRDSNRCRKEYRSQHNQIYWDYNSSWYAVGLGATSFTHQNIIVRPKLMSDYITWVNNHPATARDKLDCNDIQDIKNLSSSVVQSDDENFDSIDIEEVMDIVLKRLRTSDGLSMQYIRNRYGGIIVDAIMKGVNELGIKYNMATIDSDETLRLIDPVGFLFSNTIISNIFYELEIAMSRSSTGNIKTTQ